MRKLLNLRRCLIAASALLFISPPLYAQSNQEITGSITAIAPKSVASKLTTQTEILIDRQEPAMLTLNSPETHASGIRLYEEIVAQGGWPALPKIRLDHKTQGPQVFALRERLVAENYLPPQALNDGNQEIYDANVINAVRNFQRTHGLLQSGHVDEKTRLQLNIPAHQRLATLQANTPRILEYVKNLSTRNIFVNIPAAQLETAEGPIVYSRHNVVVGKLERPTPALKSKVSDIIFNPYWHAPASIVEKDLIPKYRKNPRIFDEMGIHIYDGKNGPEIDPATVNWDITPPDRYIFRQNPGDENSLATVKINFANKHMVYLHDTPHRELFQRNARFESSGCVRIDKVAKVIEWILQGQDGIDAAEIEMITASQQTYEVKVQSPPQVRLMYLTAWVTEDGSVHFRPDVYKLDDTGFILGQPEPIMPLKANYPVQKYQSSPAPVTQ